MIYQTIPLTFASEMTNAQVLIMKETVTKENSAALRAESAEKARAAIPLCIVMYNPCQPTEKKMSGAMMECSQCGDFWGCLLLRKAVGVFPKCLMQ